MRFIFLVIITLILGACESSRPGLSKDSITHRKPGRLLEKEYAEYRSQLISDVHYDFNLDLTRNENFGGIAKVAFKMASAQELTIDFFEGSVEGLKINDKTVKDIAYNKFFLKLPKEFLRKGDNTLEIQFTQKYSSTGSGLYRYQDPVDKNVYVYSDFEPYDANGMAPMFDQPDIKATYQSTVLAPSTWTVISSNRETSVKDHNGAKQWTFPPSAAFSTYVYSLHAGPYDMWTSEVKTKFQTIPLRLFARKSLAKYVDPKEWFSTTQQGFIFFDKYFDTPYAYKKYDQVIVPDFNSGAMENVAAVTFNEARYISRGQKQKVEKRNLAEVILHEMAHMWFGDLVTMKWWNDIWLNESFATYAAYLALTQGTPYKDSWVDFNATDKRGAYHADQLATTHPIEFQVADTDVVFANFDSITYGKGASVLKQLAFFIGPEAFQKGLQYYFKRHAGGNTTLSDFVAALERSYGRELQTWKQKWLQSANLNMIQVDWSCEAGKIKNPVLKQSSPVGYEVLRPHKTQIAVYGGKRGEKLVKTIGFEYSAAETPITALQGLSCDAVTLIYPNADDQDYAKVYLDDKSLQTVMNQISKVPDDLLRGNLWNAVWDLVVDQKLPATEYLKLVYNHTAKETNTDILRSAIGNGFTVVRRFFPQDTQWKEARNRLARDLTHLFYSSMMTAQNADVQKMWFDSYVSSVETEKDQAVLVGFLSKAPSYLKFKIDQDRRWNIVQVLNSHNPTLAKKYVDAEKSKDVSYEGQKAALETLALTPDLTVKQELWERVVKGPSQENSVGLLRPIMMALFPYNQEEFHKKFKDSFFEKMKVLKTQPPEYLRPFTSMAPTFCSTDSVSSLRSFIEQNKDLPATVEKSLKNDVQEDERCVGIRQKIKTAKAI